MDLQKLNDGDTIEDDFPLPGFRFHPTDEELVGFYLRRKVEKKPISIELIKQIDIYKYDPWDLPKVSTVGEKEWYFYCRRGKKYRNSIRPNRVTGSGFWKATGIDKPIYSASAATGGANHECVGLKKSLVYYTGSARKGAKTDWMMHEFRLPTTAGKSTTDKSMPEAETWTICRIFKRNVTYKRLGEETNQIESERRQYLSGQAVPLTALNRNNHQGMPPGESMRDFIWNDIRPILDLSDPAWTSNVSSM